MTQANTVQLELSIGEYLERHRVISGVPIVIPAHKQDFKFAMSFAPGGQCLHDPRTAAVARVKEIAENN